jgi:hypothetical protein
MAEPVKVFARTPKAQVLCMICHATTQEKAAGFPGWVKAPDDLIAFLGQLASEGLVEEWPETPGWWRATEKALSNMFWASPSVNRRRNLAH